MLKLWTQSFKSCGDNSLFTINNKFKETKPKKAKEELKKSSLKTFKELCQTEVLKTNIGESKETSREEVKGEVWGSRLKILSMIGLIESSMRTLMFSSEKECHKLGLCDQTTCDQIWQVNMLRFRWNLA